MLKAPLILNVNCAKILAKFFYFRACVKSIKKSFQMMYSNLCLSFHETVPLINHLVQFDTRGKRLLCKLPAINQSIKLVHHAPDSGPAGSLPLLSQQPKRAIVLQVIVYRYTVPLRHRMRMLKWPHFKVRYKNMQSNQLIKQ